MIDPGVLRKARGRPAAARNPDIAFVVYHSGFEPGGGGVGPGTLLGDRPHDRRPGASGEEPQLLQGLLRRRPRHAGRGAVRALRPAPHDRRRRGRDALEGDPAARRRGHPRGPALVDYAERLSGRDALVQVTADLPGFWAGSWADVKKDMAGRYPKHQWPDDPANAATDGEDDELFNALLATVSGIAQGLQNTG